EGGSFPDKYNGRLFAVAPLQRHVVVADVFPDGSSAQTKDVGHAITSNDPWFRPVHVADGPDGALYVSDMYETQISHRQHFEGQVDRTNGRIYRVQAKGSQPKKSQPRVAFDLGKESIPQLIARLRHKNRWFRQTARRVLADRKDPAAIKPLTAMLANSKGQPALEALWALYVCGGLSEPVALRSLEHPEPLVRQWTVRLLGDERKVSAAAARKFASMASSDSDVHVRSQLASTSKRLSAEQGLPVVRNLLAREEDVGDIHLPLLSWWSLESKAESDRDAVVELFEDSTFWTEPMVEKHIVQRMMRRYARAGGRTNLLACAKLLRLAPSDALAQKLRAGFEEAYQGRALTSLPTELIKAMADRGASSPALEVRLGKAEAIRKALAIIKDEKADRKQRLAFARIFGEVKHVQCVEPLLQVVRESKDDELRQVALTSLQPYDDDRVPA
ncbi:MAG: dehydrogenase, partial [Planctomycetales bacterium]